MAIHFGQKLMWEFFDAGNAVQTDRRRWLYIIGQTYSFGKGSSDAWVD